MAGYARDVVALLLISSVLAGAQGNRWDRVRYRHGMLRTEVAARDWGNQLSVTPELITFKLKDGQTLEIATHSVTGLRYSQETSRNFEWLPQVPLPQTLVAPLALLGLLHKTRSHLIGIEYRAPDSRKSALLLQGDKHNYRAILTALQSATRAPMAESQTEK